MEAIHEHGGKQCDFKHLKAQQANKNKHLHGHGFKDAADIDQIINDA
jgi:hypothetical protein